MFRINKLPARTSRIVPQMQSRTGFNFKAPAHANPEAAFAFYSLLYQ